MGAELLFGWVASGTPGLLKTILKEVLEKFVEEYKRLQITSTRSIELVSS